MYKVLRKLPFLHFCFISIFKSCYFLFILNPSLCTTDTYPSKCNVTSYDLIGQIFLSVKSSVKICNGNSEPVAAHAINNTLIRNLFMMSYSEHVHKLLWRSSSRCTLHALYTLTPHRRVLYVAHACPDGELIEMCNFCWLALMSDVVKLM